MTSTLAFLLFVLGYTLYVYGILVPLADLAQTLYIKAMDWRLGKREQ